MDFFISNAWAAEAPATGGFVELIPLLLMFVVFYFILIRPQMKRAKEHKNLIASLDKGDEIVTNGGMLGKIKQLGDNFIVIEIAKDTEVKLQRQAVSSVMPKGTSDTL